MADLSKPSIIEDAPSAPEKDATPEQDAPKVAEQVPAREERYVPLLPGDSLEDLAARWETTTQAIVDRNGLNPDFVLPWQWVWV